MFEQNSKHKQYSGAPSIHSRQSSHRKTPSTPKVAVIRGGKGRNTVRVSEHQNEGNFLL